MKKNIKENKILHILTNNSRTSTKEVAKQIKTTQQNASYLISTLKDDKTIHSFNLLVDSSKFGYSNFCVLLRLKSYTKSFVNSFTNELKKYKEITSINFLFGNFDIFIRFTTPNASNFNKILKEIQNKHSENILKIQILTQIVLYHYPNNYLSKRRYEHRLIISGDRELMQIEEVDKRVINLLNENSRMNYSQIATKLNTTAKTIISRIKNLEKKEIIKGYGTNIDHKKLNISRYYLFLKNNFSDLEQEKNFLNFIHQNPNIIEFIKVFGRWDSILIIESLEEENFKKVLFTLKEVFSDTIEDYNFLESERIEMWKYLPELELN